MAPHQVGKSNEIKSSYLSQMRDGDYDKVLVSRAFGTSPNLE